MDTQQNLLADLLLEKYEPIAIVGVGLRFPGGNTTLNEFAAFLAAGTCGTGPIPEDRWDVAAFDSGGLDHKGKIRTTGGGFLDRIDQFDPKFFHISPKEAQYIDPQQRLVLETAWEALEDANIDAQSLGHKNGGVYIGISSTDYSNEIDALAYEELDASSGTGTAHSAVPGRVSYFLGWRGPSMAIDTACSSSLVALHLAIEGLRRKECEIALCGGVNAIHHPRNHIVFSLANMLAPDGRCKTFDDSADGYSRSEGCGMIVLKRYSDAKRDGNTIIALVRGAAVRQDGESGGLTVPNGSAQQAVIQAALSASMLEPKDISYVEAHGTGTSLGDPIELGAIRAVFEESHSGTDPLIVGSLKTNIGHMEAAAGIGGIIKCALQLRDGVIYPHLNFTHPSSHIPWERYPLRVPTSCESWIAGPRRAIVNSFGFAGTIASVVLEEAPRKPIPPALPTFQPPQIFTLSAKNATSLKLQIERYRDFLAQNPTTAVSDLCYTSTTGRTHFPLRIGKTVATTDDVRAFLETQAQAPPHEEPLKNVHKIAFLFTGQGAQYPGMGHPLYAQFPQFAQSVDRCDALFAPHLGRSIKELIFGTANDPAILNQTLYTQPALFTLEYATAQVWRSFGIQPTVLIGHSIGEVVAATIAGVFTLEDAITLVAARARLMQSVSTPGGMLAVQATASDIAQELEPFADLAFGAFNAPGQCVISGSNPSLEIVSNRLGARRIKTTRLAVSHAFHSPLMNEVFDAFREAIKNITYAEPSIALISNLTGALAESDQLQSPDYWIRHIGEPVNFAAGMAAIEQRGAHVMLEIGPAATLNGIGKLCVNAKDHLWLSSMHPSDGTGTILRKSLLTLYGTGSTIAWQEYHRGSQARALSLPLYAFDRQRYWLPLQGQRHEGRRALAASSLNHPLLGPEIPSSTSSDIGSREFMTQVSADHPSYLGDHLVMGKVVFPGAAYTEILLAACDALYGETRHTIENLEIREPLFLQPGESTELRTRVRLQPHSATVEILSLIKNPEGTIERCHAVAQLTQSEQRRCELAGLGQALQAEAAQAAHSTPLDVDDFYAEYTDLGLDYGPEFRRITAITRLVPTLATAIMRGVEHSPLEYLPPVLLDNAAQTLGALIDTGDLYLPVRYDSIQFFKKPKTPHLTCVVQLQAPSGGTGNRSAHLALFEDDHLILVIQHLHLKRVSQQAVPSHRQFIHATHWLKRSLIHRSHKLARQVLVVGREAASFAPIAARLAEQDITLTCLPDSTCVQQHVQHPPSDLCWFWQSEGDATSLDQLRTECEKNYRDLLSLLAHMDSAALGTTRLWLITHQGQTLADDSSTAASLASTTLWGFGHSLLNERPMSRATLLDLPATGHDEAVFDELCNAQDDEYAIAYRGGHRHVRRLLTQLPPQESNLELIINGYGNFSTITTHDIPDQAPKGDEITVAIEAAGINFKDVLNALGLLKEHADTMGIPYVPLALGFEGAGTVLAAGPEASFKVGDAVILNHHGCMRRRITVSSTLAVRKPHNLSFGEAAGIATAYVTAYYALHHLAHIKRGDRILIHAAAGGVGQAAVQLAQLAGAEIFATASPRKAGFLRRLGIKQIMNSRTLDFADEILAATEGKGVDIVLNSLNKDYVSAGMRALGTNGRFVELGKIGIWSTEQAQRIRPDVAYHQFDLSEFPPEEFVQLNSAILHKIVAELETGAIAPITTTAYTLAEVEEAFSVLSRGANIGKLVLSMTAEQRVQSALTLDPHELYLITGGLGALGQVTAQRLVTLGARHIALINRHHADPAEIARLQTALGAEVTLRIYQGDVADPADVEQLFTALAEQQQPLGGVIHTAGTLADMPITTMQWEDIERVFRPKVYGTWLLHQAIASIPTVRFFIGYSSIAGTLGPASQANYAGGNAFIDGLMHWRAAQGLPGLSVDWGPWSEIGMAANLDARLSAGIMQQGIHFLTPIDGMRGLSKVLNRRGALLICAFDWERYVSTRTFPNALTAELAQSVKHHALAIDLPALLALPQSDRLAQINEAIRTKIAGALHFQSAAEISPNAKFLELGLDSLVAVELKNTLEVLFRIAMSASIVFDYPSIDALAAYIDQHIAPAPRKVPTPEHVHSTDVSDEQAKVELLALSAL